MLAVMRACLVVVLLSLVIVACTDGGQGPIDASTDDEPEAVPPPADAEDPAGASLEQRISAALLQAAREYPQWDRVDERPRIAPARCADPNSVVKGGYPSHVRLSQADDGAHEKKLYYLFAGLHGHSARELYASLGLGPALLGQTSRALGPLPVGFTIVKQSWTSSTEPPADSPEPQRSFFTPDPVTFVKVDDKTLHIDEQAELFIMTKLGPPNMEGTDAGWIYGTVTADGERVTSMGKVEPCMDCHAAAPTSACSGCRRPRRW